MHSHFVNYLDGISEDHINASKQIIQISKDQTIGILGRVFNDYPHTTIKPPLEHRLIMPLVKRLHAFIMSVDSKHYEGHTNFTFNNEQLLRFSSLVYKMITITCKEMLNEEGEIKEAIRKKFGNTLTTLLNDKTIITKPTDETTDGDEPEKTTVGDEAVRQIHLSYFSQILALFLCDEWVKNSVLHAEFIAEKITTDELYANFNTELKDNKKLQACLQVILTVIQAKADDSEKTAIQQLTSTAKKLFAEAKKTIVVDPLESYKVITKNRAELLTDIFLLPENWKRICNTASQKTNITSYCDKFIETMLAFYNTHADEDFKKQENEFENLLRKELQALVKSEFNYKTATARGFVTMRMQAFFKHTKNGMLQKTINDYKIYGQPLKIKFDEKKYSEPRKKLTFGIDTIAILINYFGGLITQETNNPVINDKAFKNFTVKIIFYMFAKLYTPSGRLRKDGPLTITTTLTNNPLTRNPIDVPSYYISSLIDSVARRWMLNKKNQIAYINHYDKNILNETLNKIISEMRGGITNEFIQNIKGFPFLLEPRIDESFFWIKIRVTLDKKTLELKQKLFDIKEIKNDLVLFCTNEKNVIQQVKDFKTTLKVLAQHYADRKEIFYRVLKKAPINDFEQAHSKLDQAIININQQYAALRQLIVDINSNKLTAEFVKTTFDEKIETIKKIIADNVESSRTAMKNISDLISPLTESKNQAKELHKQIFDQLNDISHHESWSKKTHGIGGGTRIRHFKAPCKVASIAKYLASDLVLDPDIYLHQMLKLYADNKRQQLNITGFFQQFRKKMQTFYRDPVTSEFYAMVDKLILVRDNNFYDMTQLQEISQQLEAFKLKQQGPHRIRASIGS